MYLHIRPEKNVSSRITIEDGVFLAQAISADGETIASIHFDCVLAVRASDEGARIKFISEAGFGGSAIVEVVDSEFLSWFKSEGLDTRDLSGVRHFSIFLGEEIIDVLTLREPVIQYP